MSKTLRLYGDDSQLVHTQRIPGIETPEVVIYGGRTYVRLRETATNAIYAQVTVLDLDMGYTTE